MKRLIILLLITSIVFVITSEGFCKIINANPIAYSLQASNTKPVANNDSLTLCGNESFALANVQDNDSDADGDLLTTSIVSGPMHGIAVLVGNEIKYSPNSNYIGNDFITYRICDNATPSLSDTAILYIDVHALPFADAGAGDTICLGVSVILGTPALAGNTYLWANGIGLDSVNAAQPNAIPLIETTYYLTVTDSITGCRQTDSVTIVLSPLVESNAGNLTKICVGSTASIGASPNPGYTYSWLPSEHLSSDTVSNPDASPIETTIYQLTVTDTASGCQSIDLVQIKVFPLPVVLPGMDESICLGDSVMIGVEQDSTNIYLWTPAAGLSSNSEQQPMAKPQATTKYTISVTNPGCIVKQQLTVFVIPKPEINAGSDTTVCAGINKILGSPEIAGNTYSWLPNEDLSSVSIAQPSANVTETSTFYLTVVNDSTGCISEDEVTLTVNSTFTNSTLQNQTINAGESIIIGSSPGFGISYNWSPSAGLNATDVSQPIANPLVTTNYSVTETDENGCIRQSTLTVSVREEAVCDSTIYTGFSPNGDGVDEYWNLPMLICHPLNEVAIVNRWGNQVWKKTNYDSQIVRWTGQNMSGEDLPDGIYYYKISYEGNIKSGWVIVKR